MAFREVTEPGITGSGGGGFPGTFNHDGDDVQSQTTRDMVSVVTEVEQGGFGSDTWAVDDRLQLVSATMGVNGTLNQATYTLRTEGSDVDSPLHIEDVLVRYPHDTRIRSRHPDREDQAIDRWVAYGVVTPQVTAIEGGTDTKREGLQIRSVGLLDLMDRRPYAQVNGRHVQHHKHRREGLRGFDDWFFNSAMPCVFNPDGVPNCSPLPLLDGDRKVYIFTYDGDPTAIPWTTAKVLRYLLHFHWSSADIDTSYVVDLIDSDGSNIIDAPPADQEAGVRLTTAQAMKALIHSLAVNRMSAPEVLDMLAAQTACNWWEEIIDDPDAEVGCKSRLRFESVNEGPIREARLQKAGTPLPPLGELPSWVGGKNNTSHLSVTVSAQGVETRPRVRGRPTEVEWTLGLLPGWLPDDHLDNVPTVSVESEQGYTQTPEYRDRYLATGSDHKAFELVGRLWLGNEDFQLAKFDPPATIGTDAIYGRSIPSPHPYSAAAYRNPFLLNPHRGFRLDPEPDEPDVGMLVPRRRRMEAPWMRIAQLVDPDDTPGSGDEYFILLEERSPIIVEISFDSGSTWAQAVGTHVTALEDRIGVRFKSNDLRDVVNPIDDADNMWFAMLEARFAVRVTCSIPTDFTVQATGSDPPWSPITSLVTGRVYYAESLRHVRRDLVVDSAPLSVYKDYPGFSSDATANDFALAQKLADQIVAETNRLRHSGSLVIPWISHSYAVGDRVRGISIGDPTGRDLSLNGTADPAHPRVPMIVAIERYFVDDQRTELVFEDMRTRPELELRHG